MLLASMTWCGGDSAPIASSWMVLSDDGGQVSWRSIVRRWRSQGRAIGHGPDLGLDGHGRTMVIPVPATFDSSLTVTRAGDFWVRPASRGHLGLKSRTWWWWPTLSSELVGRSNKGGGPRVTLAPR
jgi:hypothetical protein